MKEILKGIIFPMIVLCVSYGLSYWLTPSEEFIVFLILGIAITLDLLSLSMSLMSVFEKKHMSGFPFLALPFYMFSLILSSNPLLLSSLFSESILLGKMLDFLIFLVFHIFCTMVMFYNPKSD